MLSTLVDHPTFVALVGAVVALILKTVYDRWLSKSSRITADICTRNHQLIEAKITSAISLDAANHQVVEQKINNFTAVCKGNQAVCRDAILAKLTEVSATSDHRFQKAEDRFEDGDDLFRSTRQYQRAVIITLLHICNKMNIDCDQITKIMVDQDILQ